MHICAHTCPYMVRVFEGAVLLHASVFILLCVCLPRMLWNFMYKVGARALRILCVLVLLTCALIPIRNRLEDPERFPAVRISHASRQTWPTILAGKSIVSVRLADSGAVEILWSNGKRPKFFRVLCVLHALC